MSFDTALIVRAVRTLQAGGVPLYAFFMFGSDVARVADISRVHRDEGELKGFQRREVRDHVNGIVEFLDSGPVLFPNAIILALSPEVEFTPARGPRPAGLCEVGAAGTLSLPLRPEGDRAAWVVDGQQRSLALARARDSGIPVPVVGFVSAELRIHREQFILVNKVRPLPPRLINELLPEVEALLPRDLAANKLPSELVNLLNRDPKSPFYRLIKRASDGPDAPGVITDTALIAAIKRNLRPPLGALSPYRRNGEGLDAQGLVGALMLYWSAVRDTFSEAWGRDPEESRLMHSAGLRAMGDLMDPIMLRAEGATSPDQDVRRSLARIKPHCFWTEGTWSELGWAWNEVQSTSQNITKLADHLIRLDRELARPSR
jgi:DGQHR domain-containing protein